MKGLRRLKKSAVCAILAIVVMISVLFVGMAIENGQDGSYPEDLSALSGLPVSTVKQIHDRIGDWNTVTSNILLYKTMFDINGAIGAEDEFLLKQIGRYKADELYFVYEFAGEHSLAQDDISFILASLDEGQSLDEILSLDRWAQDREYINYRPADKGQIEKWLSSGVTPNEIISADQTAREKDLPLSDVLTQITSCEPQEEELSGRVEIQAEEQKSGLAAADADTEEKSDAGTEEKMVLKGSEQSTVSKVRENYDAAQKAQIETWKASGIDYNRYQSEGFGFYDIANAGKLSTECGKPMDEILSKRKEGLSWQDIIIYFHNDGEEREQ